MVAIKQLLLATSLLLSGVTATGVGFITSDLGVAAPEVRAVEDFAIKSRDLHDEEEIVKRVPMPKKTKAKTPKKTKAKTPKKTKAKACAWKPKTKKTRSLVRREGPLVVATSQTDINEDMYVLSASGTSVVTNLSGCTAVFLWDANNVPSIFHIFCGDEKDKSWEAIDKVGSAAKAYSIVASLQARYDVAKKEIVDYAAGEGWTALTEQVERPYRVQKGKLVKLTVKSGSRTITRTTYDAPADC